MGKILICVFLWSVHDLKPFFNYFMMGKNIKPISEVIDKKRQYFMEEGCLLIAVSIQVLVPSVSSCLALAVHYLRLNLKRFLALKIAGICPSK
jgi:hypothetical protein